MYPGADFLLFSSTGSQKASSGDHSKRFWSESTQFPFFRLILEASEPVFPLFTVTRPGFWMSLFPVCDESGSFCRHWSEHMIRPSAFTSTAYQCWLSRLLVIAKFCRFFCLWSLLPQTPRFFTNPSLCDLQDRTSIPSMSEVMAQSAFRLSSPCRGEVELFFAKRRILATIQQIVRIRFAQQAVQWACTMEMRMFSFRWSAFWAPGGVSDLPIYRRESAWERTRFGVRLRQSGLGVVHRMGVEWIQTQSVSKICLGK
jgi:hypothetical protein